jgi:hypothetical protein
MRRVVTNNALVAIGALVPLLALDYLSVRLGHNPGWLRWLGGAVLFVPPVGFFWASWPLVGSTPNLKQVFALIMFALLVSVLWFLLLAWAVIGNFHMAIGDRL